MLSLAGSVMKAQYLPVSFNSTYASEFYVSEFSEKGVKTLHYLWGRNEVDMNYDPDGYLLSMRHDHYTTVIDTVTGYRVLWLYNPNEFRVLKVHWDWEANTFTQPLITETYTFGLDSLRQVQHIRQYRKFSKDLPASLNSRMNSNFSNRDSLLFFILSNGYMDDYQIFRAIRYEYNDRGDILQEREEVVPSTGFSYVRVSDFEYSYTQSGEIKSLVKTEQVNENPERSYLYSFEYKDGNIRDVESSIVHGPEEVRYSPSQGGKFSFSYFSDGLVKKVVNNRQFPRYKANYLYYPSE